jgi:AraC family transcriptional regulator
MSTLPMAADESYWGRFPVSACQLGRGFADSLPSLLHYAGKTADHWLQFRVASLVMRSKPMESTRLLGPFERGSLVAPTAVSARLGWTGLEAARFTDVASSEFERRPLTHHLLILHTGPPDELDLRYADIKRHRPPPPGSVSVMPAGIPIRWRWRGNKSALHVYLEPDLVRRVAVETFGLDLARGALPPLDALGVPQLATTMRAVDAELTAGGVGGGSLAAESLANVLAVHLIRHLVAPPRRAENGRDGALPPRRLRSVLEYIEEHLDAAPTLAEIAAVAGVNPYHLTRQFKAATGFPPHQYVIARRVERAKHLLRSMTGLSLADVATRAGFYDQSQFSHHFKRLVGVTPSQFRTPSRIP